MTRRYACQVRAISLQPADRGLEAWIVIRTVEAQHLKIMSRGFEEVEYLLTDDQAMERYGVAVIYDIGEVPQQ